jgi:WD40 repeat protein/tRNA A-37 threonylcarbamoyl transferase component Bud32
MTDYPSCQNCGTPLTGTGNGGGYCPACILRQGLLSMEGSLPSDSTPVGPPPFFGSYELLEEIGRGGMGVVYKARQRSLKRTVAIKLLVSGAYSSESLLRRFQIEAESAASLQHPGIVAIFEFGENDNQPFYTMEYVEGKNLSEVSGGQPMEPKRAARYARAICDAVEYAHTKGILHRDLKPSNVLIDLNDRPRITDFGLAKQLHGQSDVSVAGQMLGSPNYAPPEQAAGKDVGVTSDVYSLGGLLYNLLTGRPPFLASTVQETLRLVFETDPVSPRALNPYVPQDLDTICLKCLEKDPARRYGSAQALSDELNRYLNGEPILARPVSKAEQGLRWCRRHPAIASLAATIVVALTATSAIFYVAAQRVERARVREEVARVDAEKNLYAANMQVSSGGFYVAGGFDPQGLRGSLEITRPRPGQADLRGFEWRHFWYRSQSDAVAKLAGHHHVVDASFYSPNGTRIATHSLDGNLRIWDAATMAQLASLEGVKIAGGFTGDAGTFIYSRSDNSIWSLDLGSLQSNRAGAPTGQLIRALPDGRHVAVFGPGDLPVLRTLEADAPAEKSSVIPLDTCFAVSADCRWAVVAGPSYLGIIVIDLQANRQVNTLIDKRPVIAVAISPDGQQVVSSGFDGVLKAWDVQSGEMRHSFKAFLDPIWGLGYSADGKSFAAGGNNRILKTWDSATWSEKEAFQGHASTLRCVSFSPDGSRLVSGAEDELALVWPSHSRRLPTEMPQLLRGPKWIDKTPSIAFSPDSRLFAGTAADGTIKVWRTDTIECLATFHEEARTVAFSPDGNSVLGEGFDGIVQRWTLDGAETKPTDLAKARFANWQVDPLTPEERVNLVASQENTIQQCGLCEITSARDGMFAGAMRSAPTIAMSANGQVMFMGLPNGRVEVWDMANRHRRLTLEAHKLGVSSLAVSPDGRYFATGSLDNSTKLWDSATGEQLAAFYGNNRPVWALAFSPDGKTLAAGSCDKQIILCSVALRQNVASLPLYVGVPKGYEQEVRLLKFSTDGNILAVGLGDGTLRFFRAAPFSETDASSPHEGVARTAAAAAATVAFQPAH